LKADLRRSTFWSSTGTKPGGFCKRS
jgi:hypothetical protein